MKMKIFLTSIFALAIAFRLIASSSYEYMSYLIMVLIPLLFYILFRDKANSIRVFVCLISILPFLPLALTPIPFIVSIVLNDELIRAIYRWRLIVLTGIDGSGKSTHSRLIAEWLERQGIEVKCYHIFKHPLVTFFSKSIAKTLHREIKGRGEHVYTNEFRRRIRRSLAIFRPLLQLVDNWIYIGSKLISNMLRGRWVICDRYFYDYYIRFKCLGYVVPKILEFLVYKLTPRPHVIIVLDVNPIISYKRRRREHPLWYYVIARREYHRIARMFKAPIIDTTRKSIEETQSILRKIITLRIKYPKLLSQPQPILTLKQPYNHNESSQY